MSVTKVVTDLDLLKINYLTQEQYDEALDNGEINDTELYFVKSEAMRVGDWIFDAESIEGHMSLKYVGQ